MSREGGPVVRVVKTVSILLVVWAIDVFGNLLVHGIQVTPANLVYDFVSSLAMAVFLAWLVPLIRLKLASVALILWAELFAVEYMINYIEALFFTTMYAGLADFGVALLRAAVVSGVVAAVAAFLFGSRGGTVGLGASLRDYLSTRTRRSWAVRIVVAGLIYFPVYFFFGMLVTPFVLPYYNNPAYGLRIPSFGVMVPVEILRGFLFALVLLPLMASLGGGRNTKFAALAAMLYIPGGFVALVGNTLLPPQIVPFHGTEILADSIVYGYALSRILQAKAKSV
jgi:hypothetical protein